MKTILANLKAFHFKPKTMSSTNLNNIISANDYRFNIFLNSLQNNQIDEIIEEVLSKNSKDIDESKSKMIDFDFDFKIIVEEVPTGTKSKITIRNENCLCI